MESRTLAARWVRSRASGVWRRNDARQSDDRACERDPSRWKQPRFPASSRDASRASEDVHDASLRGLLARLVCRRRASARRRPASADPGTSRRANRNPAHRPGSGRGRRVAHVFTTRWPSDDHVTRFRPRDPGSPARLSFRPAGTTYNGERWQRTLFGASRCASKRHRRGVALIRRAGFVATVLLDLSVPVDRGDDAWPRLPQRESKPDCGRRSRSKTTRRRRGTYPTPSTRGRRALA